MPRESPEAVMERFVEFINTADEQLAGQVIASDAVFYAPTHAEPLRGPAAGTTEKLVFRLYGGKAELFDAAARAQIEDFTDTFFASWRARRQDM